MRNKKGVKELSLFFIFYSVAMPPTSKTPFAYAIPIMTNKHFCLLTHYKLPVMLLIKQAE